MNRQRIQQLVGRWRWQLRLRDALFSSGAAGIVAALTLPWTVWWGWVAVAACLATLAIKSSLSRPWKLDPARIIRHLDRTYPDLEESSALWLRTPASLSLLERMQLKRIDTAISWVIPDDPPPGAPPRGFLRRAASFGLAGLLAWAVAGAWVFARDSRRPGSGTNATAAPRVAVPPATAAAAASPKIVQSGMTIVPPAYTGLPTRRVDGLNAEVPEGSIVTWALMLDREVRRPRLVFGEGIADRVLACHGTALSGAGPVTEGALYHLAADLPDGTAWNPPGIYSLKVIPDHPPTLRILRPPEARTIVEPGTPLPRVSVEVLGGDDCGFVEAHLVATVAKGSGEAVKFREQTLPFDSDAPADADAPHGRRLTRVLDLGALGMEPGDELYFFVEAHDNRQPAPNRTRSETRFIVLRGPGEKATATGRGVAGVNLIPQYFRSERQVIIDTEKLIADRPTLSDHDFRQRANDLGIDQQLLRLRYGQFLGEELETSAVADHTEVNLNPLQAALPDATGPHAAASIAQRFQQEHIEQDHEGGGEGNAGPRAAPEKPLSAGEVRRPFVDSHDTQDAATLFDRETKGTMKDALAAMWEAEGDLRTAQPPEALAPEHRALDILKDLQQSARAYVQHVGFEPAPLKIAERRLGGDAAGAPALASDRDPLPPGDPAVEGVRTALAAVPWNEPPPVWPAGTFDALRRVEPALTIAAARRPEVFLDGLQILRRLLAGDLSTTTDALRPLERALLRRLPPVSSLPNRAREPAPGFADAYLKALEAGEAKR